METNDSAGVKQRTPLPFIERSGNAGQRSYVVRFLALLLALCALAVFSNMRLATFREDPFNFHSLKSSEILIVHGLTRRQEGGLKLGFAEAFDPPKVGLFANHSFQYFSSTAFGKPLDSRYFFNYWFANLSLPELRDYLLHLEKLGKLPAETILVQITTPNNDNGGVIIELNHELPPDLLLEGAMRKATALEQARATAVALWNLTESTAQQVFGYATFILGLRGSSMEGRIVSQERCAATAESELTLGRRIALILPAQLRQMVSGIDYRYYCAREFWRVAFQKDGSHAAEYSVRAPVLNASSLSERTRRLKYGDDAEIARFMREIAQIGERNNRRVAFIVPPVFETLRPSIVDEIFDAALSRVPDLTVLDHRSLRSERSYFMRFDHPSPEYFAFVAAQMLGSGIVQKN